MFAVPRDKGVTSLFLVLLLATRAITKKGSDSNQSILCIKLLVCLLKGVIKQNDGAYDVLDLVYNTHFSRLCAPFVPTANLTTNEAAQKAFGELGLYYPHELDGGFNHPKCIMPTVDVFMVMCRLGLVPMSVLLACAALLDDALSLGSCVKKYEAPKRPLHQKRVKVCREEKALAFFAFLNHVRRGVKASMARPLEESEKAGVCDKEEVRPSVVDVPEGVGWSFHLMSQTSKDFLETGPEYEYQNVLRLGAAIL